MRMVFLAAAMLLIAVLGACGDDDETICLDAIPTNATSSSSEPGEACGTGFCSAYGWCDTTNDTCVLKALDGESCSENRQCLNDYCNLSTCGCPL